VSALLWYQHFPDVSIFLMSGFLWCQQSSELEKFWC
jgi:hypothetical protein